MAAAKSDFSSIDGQGCPICLEVFTSPRQLPCLHSFCEHCIKDYITEKVIGTVGEFEEFMCPVCRAITSPATKDKPIEEWASLLPKSPVSLVVDSKVKVKRPCDICSSNSSYKLAAKLCLVCEEFMCENCSFYHQKMKITKNHQMIAIDEVEKNPENRMQFAEGFGCPEHSDKEVEFYCKSHEVACCGTCSFLHHKVCIDVLDLNNNLPALLDKINIQKMMKQMEDHEQHLETFVEMNESNVRILESQTNGLTAELEEIRKEINDRLDDIEKKITQEGNTLYEEEVIRMQEQNYQCQSLRNAIKNSHALLETVSKHGTETQLFLIAIKTIKLLQSYSDQIREKFQRFSFMKVSVELDERMKAILSQDIPELMKLTFREESNIMLCTNTSRALRDRPVELSRDIDVYCPHDTSPWYTGIVHLPVGNTLLVDCSDGTCSLYDSWYNFTTTYKLVESPSDMCLIDDGNEVAVTIPCQKTVQFLSIMAHSIRDKGTIKTRYVCCGVAAVNREEIVVSGLCDDDEFSNRCYWSLIGREGEEKLLHEFDCPWTDQAYVALDQLKSRVYISVAGGDAVYCFDLRDGKQYFVYTSDNLIYPLGVAVDREDNIYVVGYNSRSIHKLSPDGVTLQVITSDVPNNPSRICFGHRKDHFIITNNSNEARATLHQFKHV